MKTKTFLFILLAGFLLIATSTYGQERHPRFSPEEFKAKLEAHISSQASLSQAEAQKFFPLYHGLKTKQREINRKIMALKKHKFAANAGEKEYSSVIEQIGELKEESAKLESTYFKRMCKAVPAQKVYEAIKAEDSFHRSLLKRFSPNNGTRKTK